MSRLFTYVRFVTVEAWNLVNAFSSLSDVAFILRMDQDISQSFMWFECRIYPMCVKVPHNTL